MVDHVAQVQIVAAVAPNLPTDSPGESVLDFAVESALSISSLFDGDNGSGSSDEGGTDANDISGEGQ